MNHNFLSFELTKLLPKENPYNKINQTEKFEWFEDDDSNKVVKQVYIDYPYPDGNNFELSDDDDNKYHQDAWTIIDTLNWLEGQGYIVEVLKAVYENSLWEVSVINNNNNTHFDVGNKNYNSRTEAYIKGITHCLKLINQ